MSELTELFDVFFNGRPAEPRQPAKAVTVTIDELIRRKVSYVRYGNELYRVEAAKVEIERG